MMRNMEFISIRSKHCQSSLHCALGNVASDLTKLLWNRKLDFSLLETKEIPQRPVTNHTHQQQRIADGEQQRPPDPARNRPASDTLMDSGKIRKIDGSTRLPDAGCRPLAEFGSVIRHFLWAFFVTGTSHLSNKTKETRKRKYSSHTRPFGLTLRRPACSWMGNTKRQATTWGLYRLAANAQNPKRNPKIPKQSIGAQI
ncbi:hypothetical protein Dimus_009710 [Dionaea muscipula]